MGFVLATWALIEVKALKNSTHKIQWMPMDMGKPELNDNSFDPIDNTDVVDDTEDDLFADDIDLFLDPRGKKK